MIRYQRELGFLLFSLVCLWLQWQFALSSHEEQRSLVLDGVKSEIGKIFSDLNSSTVQSAVARELERRNSWLMTHRQAKPLADNTLVPDALDALLDPLNEKSGGQYQVSVLQSAFFPAPPRIRDLLLDVSAHKDDFEVLNRESYDYVVMTYPATPDLSSLQLVIIWKHLTPLHILGTWFYLSVAIFLLLGIILWQQRHLDRLRVIPSQFRVLGLVLAMLTLTWALSIQQARQQKRLEGVSRNYQNEIRILINANASPLEFSYRQLRPLLPFAEEAIYSLKLNSMKALFQVRQGQLYGLTLSDGQENRMLWLSLLLLTASAIIFGLFLSYGLQTEIASVSTAMQKIRLPDSTLLPSENLLDPDYQHLLQTMLIASSRLKERELQQKLMARELYQRLASTMGTAPDAGLDSMHCICLFLRPVDNDAPYTLSARDWFEAVNSLTAIVRETAARVDGIVFLESGFQIGILFCGKEFSAVMLQRSVICAMEVMKQLQDMPFSGQIFTGELKFALAETMSRQEIILGGPLMLKLERLAKADCETGVFVSSECNAKTLHHVFEIRELSDGRRQILGVKELKEHLGLLQVPSPELQGTALDLASLERSTQVLEILLQALPGLAPEVLPKVSSILLEYSADDKYQALIVQTLRSWISSGDSSLYHLAIRLYADLPLKLDEADLENLLSRVGTESAEELLRLVLRHYRGSYREQWQSIFETAGPILRSQWGSLCFVRFGIDSGLGLMVSSLLCASDKERDAVLEQFRSLKERKSEFRLWYQAQGTSLSRFLASVLHGNDRRSIFLVLQLIGSLELDEFFEPLLLKCEKSMDSDLRKEILRTLKQLGADAYVNAGVNNAIN